LIPLIRSVQIRNYKSIGQASVTLEPLTVFVGPNGSGKSNFLDALSFLQECLSESVELAFKNRGGITAVRRRSAGHPTHIGIRVTANLESHVVADYAFEIAARPTEKFIIARERCSIRHFFGSDYRYEVVEGEFVQNIPGIRAKMSSDRLALFIASATEEFRPVYDFLSSMRSYSIVPGRLRELQGPDSGTHLKRDGSNAAAVLKVLRERAPERYERVCRLLAQVVEGLSRVEYRTLGIKETLQFKQDVGLPHPWTFDALSMSDGTLRALGLLLAVYQQGHQSVVAIEEPEATVHPAVADLIVEVLIDAARERQILVTTHSPDILDEKELKDDQIRVVTMEQNRTLISPLAESSREAIRSRLYTPGELLRSGELNPDVGAAETAARQLNLFGQTHWGEVDD